MSLLLYSAMITQAYSDGEILRALYLIGGGPDGVLLVQITKASVPEHYVDTHTGHNLLTSILPPLIIYSPLSSNHLILWSIDVIPCTSQLCLLSRNMQLCSRNHTSALLSTMFSVPCQTEYLSLPMR